MRSNHRRRRRTAMHLLRRRRPRKSQWLMLTTSSWSRAATTAREANTTVEREQERQTVTFLPAAMEDPVVTLLLPAAPTPTVTAVAATLAMSQRLPLPLEQALVCPPWPLFSAAEGHCCWLNGLSKATASLPSMIRSHAQWVHTRTHYSRGFLITSRIGIQIEIPFLPHALLARHRLGLCFLSVCLFVCS